MEQYKNSPKSNYQTVLISYMYICYIRLFLFFFSFFFSFYILKKFKKKKKKKIVIGNE